MVRDLDPVKKERFLNTALKLFVKRGLQNTTTAEIAKEAGTASGTLFLYFPTKLDLINELVIMISKQQSEVIYNLLNSSFSVRETFFVIWDGSIRWLMAHMDAYQYAQQIRDSGLITSEVAMESGKYFGFYYQAIQKGHAEGCIKPYPIDLIGGFLFQDIVAIMNYIRMQPGPDNLDELIRQGFDLFWDGIRVK